MSTDLYLIPKNIDFSDTALFESTLIAECEKQNVKFEKVSDGSYYIDSKIEEDRGFQLDWHKNIGYTWDDNYNPETDEPSGPQYNVGTHGPSLPFTLHFLDKLITELSTKGLNFSLYDPQEVAFIRE